MEKEDKIRKFFNEFNRRKDGIFSDPPFIRHGEYDFSRTLYKYVKLGATLEEYRNGEFDVLCIKDHVEDFKSTVQHRDFLLGKVKDGKLNARLIGESFPDPLGFSRSFQKVVTLEELEVIVDKYQEEMDKMVKGDYSNANETMDNILNEIEDLVFTKENIKEFLLFASHMDL